MGMAEAPASECLRPPSPLPIDFGHRERDLLIPTQALEPFRAHAQARDAPQVVRRVQREHLPSSPGEHASPPSAIPHHTALDCRHDPCNPQGTTKAQAPPTASQRTALVGPTQQMVSKPRLLWRKAVLRAKVSDRIRVRRVAYFARAGCSTRSSPLVANEFGEARSLDCAHHGGQNPLRYPAKPPR